MYASKIFEKHNLHITNISIAGVNKTDQVLSENFCPKYSSTIVKCLNRNFCATVRKYRLDLI